MSLSSGVHVTEVVMMRACACDFHGLVDMWVDPETRAGGWVCPGCAAEHVNNY